MSGGSDGSGERIELIDVEVVGEMTRPVVLRDIEDPLTANESVRPAMGMVGGSVSFDIQPP